MIMMHAENGIAIDVLVAQALARGETDPRYHAAHPALRSSRPRRRTERSCSPRSRATCRSTSCTCRPATPSRRSRPPATPAERVRRDVPAVPVADPRGDARDARASRARSGSARRRCARRTTSTGTRPTCGAACARTSSRSCPPTTARSASRTRRSSGSATSPRSRTASAGVEHRMELLYQGVVTGELTPRAMGRDVLHDAGADVRHVPAKGIVAPGADADVVVWDPDSPDADRHRRQAPHEHGLLGVRGLRRRRQGRHRALAWLGRDRG